MKSELQAKDNLTASNSKQIKELQIKATKSQTEYEALAEKLILIAEKYNIVPKEDIENGIRILEVIDSSLREYFKLKDEVDNTEEIYSARQESLKREIESKEKTLSAKIKDLEGINTLLARNNENLKKELKEKEVVIQELEDRLNDLTIGEEPRKKEIERLRKENKSLKEENHDMQLKVDDLSNQLNIEKDLREKEAKSSKEKADFFTKEKRRLEQEIDTLTQDKRNLQAKVHELESEYRKQKDALQEQYESEVRTRLAEREKEFSEYKKEYSRKMDDLNTKLWRETEKYNNKIEQLNAYIAELESQRKSTDLGRRSVQEKDIHRDKEIASLKAANAQLDEALRSKSREHELLQEELESLKSTINSSIEDLQKENTALAQDKIKLEKELAETKNLLRSTTQKVEELTKKYKQAEDELNSLKDDYNEAQQSLEQKEKELASVKMSLDGAIRQREEKAAHIKFIENSINQQKLTIQELEKRIKEYDEEKNYLSDRIRELEQESESLREREKLSLSTRNIEVELRDQITELQESLKEKESDLKRLRSEYNAYKDSQEKERAGFERDIQEKEAAIQELEESRNKLQSQVHNLNQKLNLLKGELENTRLERNQYKAEKESLAVEKALLRQESSENIKEVKEKIAEYENALQAATGQITQLQQELAEVILQRDELQSQLEGKVDKAVEWKKKYEEINEEVVYIKQHINDLEAQLKQKDEEIQERDQTIENLDKELEEANQALEESARKAQQLIDNFDAKIKDLDTKLQIEIQNKENLTIEHRAYIDKSVKRIHELEEEKQHLEVQCVALQEERDVLAEKLKHSLSEIDSLTNALKNKNEDGDKAQTDAQISALKESYEKKIAVLEKEKNEWRAYLDEIQQAQIEKDQRIFDLDMKLAEYDLTINSLRTQLQMAQQGSGQAESLHGNEELECKIKKIEELENTVKKLEGMNAELEEALHEAMEKQFDAEQQMEDMNEELEKAKNRIAELEAELEKTTMIVHPQASDDPQETIQRQAQEIERLKKDVSALDQQNDKLQEECAKLERENNELKRNLKEMTSENQRINTYIVKLEKEKQVLEKDLSQKGDLATGGGTSVNPHVEQLEKENERLKRELSELRDEIEMMNHQNNQIRDQYEKTISAYNSRNDTEEGEGHAKSHKKESFKDALLEENAHLREENEELRNQINSLQNQVVLISQQKRKDTSDSEKIFSENREKDLVLKNELESFAMLATFKDGIDVRMNTKEELQATLRLVKKAIQNLERENEQLKGDLSTQETVSKQDLDVLKGRITETTHEAHETIQKIKEQHELEKNQFKNMIQSLKEDIGNRLSKIASETEQIIKVIYDERPKPKPEIQNRDDLSSSEKIIWNNLLYLSESARINKDLRQECER